MASIATVPPQFPETTDLERRVLAHERILQSLIAYMSLTEPRFANHLRERFVEPMAMVRQEHDYRDVDDYAAGFIREVMRIGELPVPKTATVHAGTTSVKAPEEHRVFAPAHRTVPQDDRVQLKERSGIWEVRVDGVFRGDYCLKQHAVAAAALADLSLR